MRAVLVGPPGAGKGTQAKLIAGHFGVPAISTGDIFRAHVAAETDLGGQAADYMNAGRLVPDSVTNAMVTHRLRDPDAAHGFLLDGYPRSTGQAQALDAALSGVGTRLSAVLRLRVDREELVRRLSQRRVCTDCAHVAQVDHGPAEEHACKRCTGPLTRRPDDDPAVIRRRLDVFASETAPMLTHYQARGLLVGVEGVGAVETVAAQAITALTTLTARSAPMMQARDDVSGGREAENGVNAGVDTAASGGLR